MMSGSGGERTAVLAEQGHEIEVQRYVGVEGCSGAYMVKSSTTSHLLSIT